MLRFGRQWNSNQVDDPNTTTIDYDYHLNSHSVTGAAVALPVIFERKMPASLLDVGCGVGTRLRAALDLGVKEVAGVEGVEGVRLSNEEMLVDPGCVRFHNLCIPLSLDRKFDLALCLEVAEHIEKKLAPCLIRSLTKHSNWIVFSAAAPFQSGQNHVNCQWPEYWQRLFNENGFVCEDTFRGLFWNDMRIEPWYRQNIFLAYLDAARAGMEPRIRGMIHPEILATIIRETTEKTKSALLGTITSGKMPRSWYANTTMKVIKGKVGRYLSKMP